MSNGTFQLRNAQGMPIETNELVADMRRVAVQIKKNALTFRDCESFGRYAPKTVMRCFGSWNKALLAAGRRTSGAQAPNAHIYPALTRTGLLTSGPRTWELKLKQH